MQIEWSEEEVLKLAESARKRRRGPAKVFGVGIDGRRRCERGAKYGSGQEQGGRGRSAVSRAAFELWANPSCSLSHQQRRRTELDLSSGKAFDNCHWPTTLGAAPKRARFPGRWRCLVRSAMELCQVLRSIVAVAWSVGGWPGSRSGGFGRSPWGADAVGSGARTHRARGSSVSFDCGQPSALSRSLLLQSRPAFAAKGKTCSLTAVYMSRGSKFLKRFQRKS